MSYVSLKRWKKVHPSHLSPTDHSMCSYTAFIQSYNIFRRDVPPPSNPLKIITSSSSSLCSIHYSVFQRCPLKKSLKSWNLCRQNTVFIRSEWLLLVGLMAECWTSPSPPGEAPELDSVIIPNKVPVLKVWEKEMPYMSLLIFYDKKNIYILLAYRRAQATAAAAVPLWLKAHKAVPANEKGPHHCSPARRPWLHLDPFFWLAEGTLMYRCIHCLLYGPKPAEEHLATRN